MGRSADHEQVHVVGRGHGGDAHLNDLNREGFTQTGRDGVCNLLSVTPQGLVDDQ
ncbi:MAG: hypothetical protein ABI112_04830 [Terracoccus sp.]